jgi:hypothetical protein
MQERRSEAGERRRGSERLGGGRGSEEVADEGGKRAGTEVRSSDLIGVGSRGVLVGRRAVGKGGTDVVDERLPLVAKVKRPADTGRSADGEE